MNGNDAASQQDTPAGTPAPAAGAGGPRKRRIAGWVFALIGTAVLLCMGVCAYAGGILYGWWPGIPGVLTSGASDPTPQPGSVQVNETFDGVYKWPSGTQVKEANGKLTMEVKNHSFFSIRFDSMAGGSDYSIDMHGGNTNWLQLGNIDAEFDATVEKDAGLAEFGAACRFQNEHNFYLFLVGSNGAFSIGKWINEKGTPLQNGTSSAIKMGAATNHIRIVCTGNQLSLSVNGTHLATVTDSTLSNGILALLAGAQTDRSPDVIVSFDNLVIRAP